MLLQFKDDFGFSLTYHDGVAFQNVSNQFVDYAHIVQTHETIARVRKAINAISLHSTNEHAHALNMSNRILPKFCTKIFAFIPTNFELFMNFIHKILLTDLHFAAKL